MQKKTKIFLGITGAIIGSVAICEVINTVKENNERHTWYNYARQYCNAVNKPLLEVGMRRYSWQPPDGDYVIDTDPAVLDLPNGVQGTECEMPFPDKMFGFVYNAHTLEHLNSVEDIEKAISECRRVADFTILLTPNPHSIVANFFCPTHKFKLWMDQVNNKIIVKPSEYEIGIGSHFTTDASFLTYELLPMPAIIEG
jgi:hypothetical protein